MIANNKKSNVKSQKLRNGYTLVELLASTSVIVIVSGLILGIIYSTLRGGNKTRVTNDVSQNGNYALSIISNTALTSQDVIKIGGNDIQDCSTKKVGSSIEFINSSGASVEFSCDPAISSISATTGGATTYLIDNNAVKVESDIQSCNFSCSQNSGDPYSQPVIGVNFKVSQRSESALFENAASSNFNTSVTMRNYSPR